MKPLLERKRRARINKCLDELKDIMTAALQSQGENVSKLEKADILELTVRHLHKMQQARRLMTTSRNPLEEIHRYLFFDKFLKFRSTEKLEVIGPKAIYFLSV